MNNRQQRQMINREYDQKYVDLMMSTQYQQSDADAKFMILNNFQNQYLEALSLIDR